jgi:hypothetical protein
VTTSARSHVDPSDPIQRRPVKLEHVSFILSPASLHPAGSKRWVPASSSTGPYEHDPTRVARRVRGSSSSSGRARTRRHLGRGKLSCIHNCHASPPPRNRAGFYCPHTATPHPERLRSSLAASRPHHPRKPPRAPFPYPPPVAFRTTPSPPAPPTCYLAVLWTRNCWA